MRDQGDPEPGKCESKVEERRIQREQRWFQITPLKEENNETYLMHRIDEGLSVISAELTNHSDLIFAREDFFDERGDFMWGKNTAD